MEKRYKCPFCLHSFTKQQAVLVDDSRDVVKYKCPNQQLKDDATSLVCNRTLPINFFEHDSHVISISGATGVGKTFYLSALLHQVLYNRELHRFGITGSLIGEANAVRELRNLLTEHRESGAAISASKPGIELAGFVLHVTINRHGRRRSLYLSLFDNPGEKFTDPDYMHRNMFNVYKADAVLFLIEPIQIDSLADAVLDRYKDTKGRVDPGDLYDVVYNVTELLKYAQRNGHSGSTATANTTDGQPWDGLRRMFSSTSQPDDRVQIPVAVGISKADLFHHVLLSEVPYDQADFAIKYLRGNRLDISLVDQLSAELHDVLFDPNSGDLRLRSLLESSCKDYRLFALKSIDGNAYKDRTGIPEGQNTQGVLLPFLWLLHRLNLL